MWHTSKLMRPKLNFTRESENVFVFLMKAPTLSSAWNSDVMAGVQQPYHDKEITNMKKRQR